MRMSNKGFRKAEFVLDSCFGALTDQAKQGKRDHTFKCYLSKLKLGRCLTWVTREKEMTATSPPSKSASPDW